MYGMTGTKGSERPWGGFPDGGEVEGETGVNSRREKGSRVGWFQRPRNRRKDAVWAVDHRSGVQKGDPNQKSKLGRGCRPGRRGGEDAHPGWETNQCFIKTFNRCEKCKSNATGANEKEEGGGCPRGEGGVLQHVVSIDLGGGELSGSGGKSRGWE